MSDDEAFAELFVSSMNSNLNWNVRFHNEVHRLMHNEIVTINFELDDCKNEEDKGNLKFRKHSLVGSFSDYALNNSFLMQWSLVEEILYLVHKFRYSDIAIPKKTSFQKYKPMVEAALGDPFSYAPWQFFVTAERVRNCLLHANARISLSKDKDWLKNELSRNKKFYSLSNDRISVTGEFVNKLTGHARVMMQDLMANNSMQRIALRAPAD